MALDRMEMARRLGRSDPLPDSLHEVETENDWGEFERLHLFLREEYPLCHRVMEQEKVLGHSLLFRWPGPPARREGVLFLAHQDVVEAQGKWEHPPFDGIIEGGYVWGRGALGSEKPAHCPFRGGRDPVQEGIYPGAGHIFCL